MDTATTIRYMGIAFRIVRIRSLAVASAQRFHYVVRIRHGFNAVEASKLDVTTFES